MDYIKDNDYILIYAGKKHYFTRAEKNKVMNTKTGSINLSDVIGKRYGIKINNHYIIKPGISDIIMYGIKRKTQIIYPKEAGMIILKLNLKNGDKVFECGTGSGALSIFISNAIAPDGKLYTYEKQVEFYNLAKKNLTEFNFSENVIFQNKDIADGIEEKDFDSAFLDVKEPWYFIKMIKSILKPGGILGVLVPTTNQVSATIREIEKYFGHIEVMEILLREYKINADRLRPVDRMIAHTGYLIFAR